MSEYTTNIRILNDVVTTTVSGIYDVTDRPLKSLHFLNTESTSGTVTFTVHVSNDGHEFIAYNRMVSNATTDAKVANIALNSVINAGILFFPADDIFKYIRVTATGNGKAESVGGKWRCTLQTSS